MAIVISGVKVVVVVVNILHGRRKECIVSIMESLFSSFAKKKIQCNNYNNNNNKERKKERNDCYIS